jgi:hypothetical protein
MSKEIEECHRCVNCNPNIFAPLGCPKWAMSRSQSKAFGYIVIGITLLIAGLLAGLALK